MFIGKTLLITGGTGSFSNAVIRKLLNSDIKELRISQGRRRLHRLGENRQAG